MAKNGSASMKAPATARKEWGTSAKSMLTDGKRTSGATAQTKLAPPKATDSPVAGGRGGGGAAGRMTTQKAAPAVATRKPAVKPMSTMDKVRADKGLMDTIRTDAAALRKPAQKTAPKAAASKKSSGLSANKSYADYKKLMESM
jgi:hypothetical protein